MALLLPLLAVCTGSAVPATVDAVKLGFREPGLTLPQVLHCWVYIWGLISLVAVIPAVAVALLLTVLTRHRDLSRSARLLFRWVWAWLARHNSRSSAAAGAYATLLGFGLLLAAGYKLNLFFFTTFKNQQLAALLLACLVPLLLAVVAVAGLAMRALLLPVTALVGRVPVLRVLASVAGALALFLLGLAGVASVLIIKYMPIVRMIDWRPMSYPGLTLGVGALVLALVLWGRDWRLERARAPGIKRRVALALWAAALLGVWGYSFATLGDRPSLRSALLRRGYGAARSFDMLSRLLDFDRDGYLSFFGGGDCAPFNGEVHPGADEIPGNGVDDNCFGGDLNSKQIGTPARRFVHPVPASLKQQKVNVVLITMDGLRADHLGAYGYAKPTSPRIDAFARRSTLFERAYVQAPSTRYSIPSFMTSRYSSQVPRKSVLSIPRPILPSALLMAEVFKKEGYRTGAALSYQVFARSWKMDQGFDFYDISQASFYIGKGKPGWNAKQPYLLVDVARKFLDSTKQQEKPFFLWVHVYEPHPPYVVRKKPVDFGGGITGLYDGELRYGDGKVGQLLDLVAAHPQAGRTVVALSADHGRGLGEHGLSSHGYDLFVESLHVPLIIHVPGGKPCRIKSPVALLDLLPTLVNLSQIGQPFKFEGQSLVPQLTSCVEPTDDRPIFSEVQVGFHNSHFINAITTRNFKLIYDVSYNTFQLYDLRADPKELKDVADRFPAALKRLKGKLFKVAERATMPGMEEEIRSSIVKKAPLTPGIRKVNFGHKIQFLGYEITPRRPSAGQIMTVTWYFKVLAKVSKDYKVVARLKALKTGHTFDAKHVTVRGQYPTSKWKPGQIIADRQNMRLFRTGPQDWEVWMGFAVGHSTLAPIAAGKVERQAVRVGTLTTY